VRLAAHPDYDAAQSWAMAAAAQLPVLLASAQRAACHYLMWLRLAALQGQISALTRSQHEQNWPNCWANKAKDGRISCNSGQHATGLDRLF
jgi:hypothetical protein